MCFKSQYIIWIREFSSYRLLLIALWHTHRLPLWSSHTYWSCYTHVVFDTLEFLCEYRMLPPLVATDVSSTNSQNENHTLSSATFLPSAWWGLSVLWKTKVMLPWQYNRVMHFTEIFGTEILLNLIELNRGRSSLLLLLFLLVSNVRFRLHLIILSTLAELWWKHKYQLKCFHRMMENSTNV